MKNGIQHKLIKIPNFSIASCKKILILKGKIYANLCVIIEILLFDTILVDKSYTEGNFAKALNNNNCHLTQASPDINNIIKEVALKNNMKYIEGNVLCSECFDYYIENIDVLLNRLPSEFNITAAEMESFALFYTAKYLNKKAACLLTVVDSHYKKQEISSEEREKSLNDMILLALESSLNIN